MFLGRSVLLRVSSCPYYQVSHTTITTGDTPSIENSTTNQQFLVGRVDVGVVLLAVDGVEISVIGIAVSVAILERILAPNSSWSFCHSSQRMTMMMVVLIVS